MIKKKLLLHVGLPKTGTTALQRWCDEHRSQLASLDVHYPEADPPNRIEPKHQFLVSALNKSTVSSLSERFQRYTGTTILSAEGLTNHLYDFRPHALKTFRELTREFEVTAFMAVREKTAWLHSYYKQSLINPPTIPGFHWATSLEFADFCALPRIRQLVDTLALSEDLHAAFGTHNVVIAKYEDDSHAAFLRCLGLDGESGFSPPPRVHISFSDDLAELIRQVNGMRLATSERASFLSAVQACFRTEHTAFEHFYQPAIVDYRGRMVNEAIAAKLAPRNPRQAELISIFNEWLAKVSEQHV